MKSVSSYLGDWWRLVLPYFRSEERWIAIGLLVGAIVLTLAAVTVNVAFSEWNRRFYDSLQNKDEAAFWTEMVNFGWIAALAIAFGVARGLVSPYLRLRWRRWLTGHYLSHWLDGRGYYRIELERKVDNADQRIAEDLRLLGFYTMTLLLGLISAVATLVSFLFILWQLSGPISLSFIGLDVVIPGYMVWAALIYAFLGTWLANLVGRRLIPLNFLQQRYEANFRFGLMRVRENAEGIALYRGEPRENEVLEAKFTDVFNNAWRVLVTEMQLVFYQIGYGQLAIIFPYIVTAPRFFAGAITLGVVMQTAQAFGQVQTALSFFIDNYTNVAELRAVMDRLKGLQDAIEEKPAENITVAAEPGRADVGTSGLDLALPNGQTLLKDLDLVLPKGTSTLITGTSGSGKSTLFRAMAGIWPFGRGRILIPAGARVLFLPQKPYIPIATLRDAVKYPDENSTATDADIVSALEAARLGHLASRLDEEVHWSNTLSGGEQQRLAIARALVFRPDWLFLDEATASLDEANEAAVYGGLKERLPGTTMISIGHRPSLRQWHEQRLELKRAPGETGSLNVVT
ncbi:ABC transporter ATP-binding protein/permease [Reyranella sp. MMS21-HV4-11]|uniref:ABC transporter ATP-binding protein/permease n=1 Tax=Reyranella humidisoli TaxID=2849149 RepID=A0ABS6IQW0_9HYPH|nr:ABC transporter ATP-binding protein/permease [Reyranella sp. MMS21-HV4-11]MBU8876394.1 ABC transporter ATP-binding protein/permease [Reyranella sp. MMS21-HV4-11]